MEVKVPNVTVLSDPDEDTEAAKNNKSRASMKAANQIPIILKNPKCD